MKSTKVDKKPLFEKYQLGIVSGIKFTLFVPSRHYKLKDKQNKYFIQSYYNQKQKQHKQYVRSMYEDFISGTKSKLTIVEKTEKLILIFDIYINEIVTTFNLTQSQSKITLSTNLQIAINTFYQNQKLKFEMGQLAKISDYKDRNKKLNDYLKTPQNQVLTIKNLNKEFWTGFRYFLLSNYNIKSNLVVNEYINYVKGFYVWLQVDKELPIINHTLQLKKLNANIPKKYKDLTIQKGDEIIEVLSKNEKYLRLYIMSLLIFENGKRNFQAYRLRAKDIDLENNKLTLEPKNRTKEKEIVYISEELALAIKKVYNNTIARGITIEPNDYLLGGKNRFTKSKKPINGSDMFDAQVEKFRIDYPQYEKVLFYELKHTVLTAVSSKDIKLAQKMASHGKITTTEIYDRSNKASYAIPRKKLLEDY